jgi:hypothetical protein
MATFTQSPSGDVVLCLTAAEARGLATLAREGASALLNDADSARTHIGGGASVDAAKRGLGAIIQASIAAKPA